ncbi:Asp-tRNA(Asn)/Glu-tRNA(Gln) amidotransferase subunit GatA [Anaerococcus hydrogenalis]|uniref:Glutamyl-tRNA(Gln) amidotransferase subunit A n=1 Tax=Anaerococcus hydrogenalis TaxID=33029 RepID=A0A2N6UL84_9FIRM|nr:Asp-tRNA(Asn)/Glu-tRNA(Gln) amidotransferase subunit GatA [Anaerococcus hydrogenalis]MDK7694584.1 Asp-tRNA(Asn)/Glu-tRNA(Gln) amidotransferase subunit GatA [Anaerococcus hydrogenalis]MDK7696362.1 Asp-tRNA(Asn)/Glu-tRNA(Gln) amidotransferase subunit GatA [Anaerococcus hydrogenalis]MDK7707611.1 Asp-tRNA(Asn)/Glu-tRNA(Gln) amidotransferase subunit GatA [Anaerococcus hydrogenalis]PMC82622.1 Asp-tRNA(Asn)/Glu-tRNA(Gln) amidotransferase subunit GatA [Anaerococcus hydrogenalis]
MDIKETINKFKNNEISVYENTKNILDKIKNDQYNAYISINEKDSLERAKYLDEKLKNKEELGSLFGIAVSVKDNISYKNMKMTCASKMLEDFNPVFNAKVVENLLKEDAIIIAKTNMDEFAMGGSGETSYFGPIKNPLDENLIPGGSSSGSAVSVAKGDVLVSLGTDTGGSVRQPASYCNIIGYKPTYSLMSRSGVVSMANSLDQVSFFAKDVKDLRTIANTCQSPDKFDMTSCLEKYEYNEENFDFSGKKIAVIKNENNIYNLDKEVEDDYKHAIEILKELGAEIIPIDLKYSKYANEVYNVVMSSEVSSNLSRFDGIRFGHQTDEYKNVEELFIKNRSEGFGENVQRRIALGTMYLSSEDDQRIYKQGLKLRTLIVEEFKEIFKNYDLLITPTTVDLPSKLGIYVDDPLKDFTSDIFNVCVNLTGFCGVSIPVRKGISGSIQIIGDRFKDNDIINACETFERKINED